MRGSHPRPHTASLMLGVPRGGPMLPHCTPLPVQGLVNLCSDMCFEEINANIMFLFGTYRFWRYHLRRK